MKNLLSARRKKAILSAIAAGFCFGNVFLPKNAEAMEQFNIGWDDKDLFDVQYYGASDRDETRESFFHNNKNAVLNYDLTGDIKNGLNKAFRWWA